MGKKKPKEEQHDEIPYEDTYCEQGHAMAFLFENPYGRGYVVCDKCGYEPVETDRGFHHCREC